MKYELEECVGSRVRAISRKIDRVYRQNLGNSGVTENQLSVMMALYKTGQVEQKIIGEILTLEKSSLSRNLIRLIEAGMVVKSGPVNRPLIQLTNKGRSKVDELIPKWEIAMDEIHKVLSNEDVSALKQFEESISKL